MSTLWNICHFFLITIQYLYFGTNLYLAHVTEEDPTNKTSSNEEALWEEQDKANQQSICGAPDYVQ